MCVGLTRICVGHGCAWCVWKSCDLGVGGGSGEVAANVCMMFWNIVVWVLSVSVEASICLSVLRLMLLVSVVNLSSTVSTSSLMVLVNFSNTRGEVAAVLLIAWVF